MPENSPTHTNTPPLPLSLSLVLHHLLPSAFSPFSSMISMLSSTKEKNPPADNDASVEALSGQKAKDIKGWDFHDKEA